MKYQIEKDEQINQLKKQYKGEQLTKNLSKFRLSQPKGTASSLTTILAICNSMVGTIVLIIPVNFAGSGILLSIILMLIMGLMSMQTCVWILKPQKDDEDEIGLIVKRVLGKSWYTLCALSASTLIFCVGMVYFVLINSTFWQILSFFFYRTNVQDNVGDPNEIIFDKFSRQLQ
ncbi:hypothetical protein PPERSA_08088 [Pseudocohnilembus persalinus]|uniref:Amino acid transporter transmembrane domain-containing protein n=1 Tax=Pseudocohnilembus persalinus TaxID=266149 RepID=A0A0V0R2N7_PSEPJ|nr:hypothetical protein PPERSA_08088 [Pseudocohnilembus persalinus]|eukprot:KRX08777.1 hypothetical protein PPERSA_08088 [Pseudocohnilembus persalinus]